MREWDMKKSSRRWELAIVASFGWRIDWRASSLRRWFPMERVKVKVKIDNNNNSGKKEGNIERWLVTKTFRFLQVRIEVVANPPFPLWHNVRHHLVLLYSSSFWWHCFLFFLIRIFGLIPFHHLYFSSFAVPFVPCRGRLFHRARADSSSSFFISLSVSSAIFLCMSASKRKGGTAGSSTESICRVRNKLDTVSRHVFLSFFGWGARGKFLRLVLIPYSSKALFIQLDYVSSQSEGRVLSRVPCHCHGPSYQIFLKILTRLFLFFVALSTSSTHFSLLQSRNACEAADWGRPIVLFVCRFLYLFLI